jgi:hypothetical protein
VRQLAQLIGRNEEMLKAIVSYSKKIPVPDSEFSSQGYSLSLETEIPESDPAAIQARLSQTFHLVKDQVEHELANGNGNGHAVKPTETGAQPPSTRVTEKASNKQVKYLTDLASQKGVGLTDLNADIRKRYGVAGLYDLSRKQASDLLDSLNGKKKAA